MKSIINLAIWLLLVATILLALFALLGVTRLMQNGNIVLAFCGSLLIATGLQDVVKILYRKMRNVKKNVDKFGK